MRIVSVTTIFVICLAAMVIAEEQHDDKGHHDDKEHHDDHKAGEPDISAKSKHFDDEGHHHDDFDHEAVTGSHKDAEEFKELSPEESKKRLAVLIGKMDTNKDGFVDSEELKQWVIQSFKNLDTEDARHKLEDHDDNSDKKVSWWEYVEKAYGYKQKEVEEFKKEKSKEMSSFLEMLADDEEKFKLADANNDGILDLEEYTAFAHPVNHPRMAPYEIKRTLKDYDKNKDGFIDVAEFLGAEKLDNATEKAEKEHFQQYDLNKDGKLDSTEVQKWIMPGFDQSATQEVKHLVKETDADKDGKLSKEEILNKNDLWVGSQATDYGKHLDDLKKDEL